MTREFKFLVFVIILMELGIFACGLRIVYNRHNYRTLFIQLEREQQTYHALIDELNRVRVELATLEQPSNIVNAAQQFGLVPVDNNQVVVIDPNEKGAPPPQKAPEKTTQNNKKSSKTQDRP